MKSYNFSSHVSLSLISEKTTSAHYLHSLLESLAEQSRKRPCLSTPLECSDLTGSLIHNCLHLGHIGKGSTCAFRVFMGANPCSSGGDFCLTWFPRKLLQGAEFFSGIRPFSFPEGNDYQCHFPEPRTIRFSGSTVKEHSYNHRNSFPSQEIFYLNTSISIICE